ncbi:MAG: alkaline phosphatase [Dysgonamonadaceae bacterium]|jgi:alkaline phosphatase|nr:alkaline phosphatase [Dysgonamonadaceae bacterium]
MRKIALLFSLLFFCAMIFAQEVRPVKNVIVMIPDGTSTSVYSAARWFKIFNGLGESLSIDPYFTGTVTTTSSNAPIADSAPAGSAYATGILSQTGNIAIHPQPSENDIFPVDASRSYQPAATILEAARIKKGRATGLVVTSEFTHATPASFAAHHYSRGNYTAIAPQMAYQNLDVMFGGGTGILSDDMKRHFRNNGTTLIEDDRNALLNYNGSRVWALFGERALPYDIDRNPDKVPSLAEMTQKALEILSKNENGFFLMVEGSQVDWAAHANDPIGIISEYLAFDKAVGEVMEFAKKDGSTAVLILSDHGNSGFSIGSNRCPGYDRLSLARLFHSVSQFKLTANGLEALLINTQPNEIRAIFKEYTGIDLTDDELESLLLSRNYIKGEYEEVNNDRNLSQNIVTIYISHTCFGFTTSGHTGEEVLLASYHPLGDKLGGHVMNTQVNTYLQKVLGLETSLRELTDKIFVKHTDVFSGLEMSVDKSNEDFPVLTVKKGRNTLQLTAHSSIGKLNGNMFNIGSVVVYIDRNDTFYLPKSLIEKL